MEDINALSFATFLILSFTGAWYHWRKMKNESRVMGTFRDYLFADSPTNSLATGVMLLVAAWTAATSGTADLVNPQLIVTMLMAGKLHIASFNAVGGAFIIGYGFDSLVNKGGKT
jgi:hypothetical protein